MKKFLTLAAAIIGLFMAQGASATIYPVHSACEGAYYTLYDSTFAGGVSTGGIWSSSNLTVATIHPTAGFIHALSAGTTTIAYTGGTSGTTSIVFTVHPMPYPITGGGGALVCVGSTLTLASPIPGGTWHSPSSAATIGISSGVVTGIHTGSSLITYTTAFGCWDTSSVNVLGAPADTVYGAASVCAGSTITLTAYASGGTWFSSTTSVATVSSGGVVTGITAGTTTISHTVTNSCGTTVATRVITVGGSSAGSISGTTTVVAGSTTTLSGSITGGTWASGSTSIATVSGSGVVTGVAAGTAVITYTVAGCSGPVSTTTIVTVTAAPSCIEGDVLFTGASYAGPVKVWLIKYNATTHMLTAIDSLTAFAGGTSAHYSFCGLGTDSFRIKAACPDTLTGPTGYLPTYHTASSYWYAATIINHVSGISDINKHITMGYGTLTSGPGFIAGDVTTGANKGTADGIPAVGMLIYCVNSTTNAILQQTTTNASGHYSFSNLPVGEPFKIYPEMINYATTPFTAITLTSGSPTMTAANFEQHTISMTITPKGTGVNAVTALNAGINVFPNPASGKLNVQWNVQNAGTGTIAIADVTGRQVLSTTVDMNQATGNTTLNLNGISKGIYMVSIKANGVNYNNKIEIQ